MHWTWRLRKWLTPGGSKLRPLERRCLDLFLEALDPETRELVKAQAECIDLVERSHSGRAVSLLSVANEKDQETKAVADRTAGVAACSIQLSRGAERIHAEFYFDDGVLRDLVFNKPPGKQTAGEFERETVEILRDLSAATPAPAETLNDKPTSGHLGRLASTMGLKQIYPPATPAHVRSFVRRFDCPLPEDLQELLAETDGFETGQWVFRGTCSLPMLLPDRNLHVLAHSEPSRSICLCIDESETRPRVYAYDVSTHSLFNESSSVVGGLEILFQRSPSDFDFGEYLDALDRGEKWDWLRPSDRI